MLIISKFHDYYDSSIKEGVDKSIIYNRITTGDVKYNKDIEIKTKHLFTYRGSLLGKSNPGGYKDYQEYRVIGFSGKIYIALETHIFTRNLNYYSQTPIDQEVWYFGEDILTFFKDKGGTRDYLNTSDFIRKYHKSDSYLENFFEFKTPVFLTYPYSLSSWDHFHRNKDRSEENIIINPILKNIQFYKLFDSFSAFQEISMFISGVLGVGNRELLQISDKDKIGQHGFDKWSFRNPDPPKRKQK